MTGTSQAAPHGAGLSALLAAMQPQTTADDIRKAIEVSAWGTVGYPNAGNATCGGVAWNTWPNYIYGYGIMDAVNAINQLIGEQRL